MAKAATTEKPKQRDHLVKTKVVDKNGVERTVYRRPDQTDAGGTAAKVGVAPRKRNRVDEDDFETEELEQQQDVESADEVPEWEPNLHEPAFYIDQDWGSERLNVDNFTQASKVVETDGEGNNFLAYKVHEHFGDDAKLKWGVEALEQRWRATVNADVHHKEEIPEMPEDEMRYLREQLSSESFRTRLQPDKRAALDLVLDVGEDTDKAMQAKVYVALKRREYLNQQIARISEKIEEQEGVLRALDDGAEVGKFDYLVQPEEGVGVSFTPYRAFDEDLARQYLNPEELEAAEYQPPPKIDHNIVKKLVMKEDRARYEAMRKQGPTRMSRQ